MRTHQLVHRSLTFCLVWLFVLLVGSPALAQDEAFIALLHNQGAGDEECLIFGENGQAMYPEAYNWGHGTEACGFPGGVEPLIENRQAIWHFVPLGEGQYMIRNASQNGGGEECLIFSGHGQYILPERYTWGPGDFCGFPGGKEALLENEQAVFTLHHLEEDLFTITNSSRYGEEECLIFGGHGQNPSPERYNWGPGEFCGFPGGLEALLDNGQAVWRLEELEYDNFEVPESWLDGALVLQNEMHAHQRLQPSHEDDGRLMAEWGIGEGSKWLVEESNSGNFVFLRNVDTDRRLHVGHDGNGELYLGQGDDDAFLWTFEPSGSSFKIRNKRFPYQRLRVHPAGVGMPSVAWGGDESFGWTVDVLETVESPVDEIYEPSPFYLNSQVVLQNKMHTNNLLHVGHDGNGQLYAEPYFDDAYFFKLELTGDRGYVFLRSQLHTDQRVHVGHNGNGQLYAEWGDDDAYRWTLEPAGGQSFFLRNKMHPDQRLHVGHNGNGQLYAEWGDDDAYRWFFYLYPDW